MDSSLQDIRLSVSEAAKIFGVSQQTIRRALKSGAIKYIISRGRYQISFLSLLRWSQASTSTKNKLVKRGVGQFVDQWKIQNPLYSPNPSAVTRRLKTQKTP